MLASIQPAQRLRTFELGNDVLKRRNAQLVVTSSRTILMTKGFQNHQSPKTRQKMQNKKITKKNITNTKK